MTQEKQVGVNGSVPDSLTLRAIIGSTGDAILVTEAEPVDEPGPRVVYVNESFTKMTGYAPQDIIGKSPRILQGPGSDRRSLDKIRSALEAWEPVRVQILNYRKSDEEFWVELDIAPVADERGWFTHWVSVQRDITKGKVAREHLRATLARNSPDVASIFEPSGEIRYISESAGRVLGLHPEDFERKRLLENVHPDDRERVARVFFSGGGGEYGTSEVDFRVRHMDGLWRHFEARINDLTDDPEVGGIIVNAWDVTKRRKAEESLRLRDRAIAASSNGILITDCTVPENPIVYFNPALERTTGYSSEEVLGRNPRFLQGSDVRQPEIAKLREAVKKGTYWYGVLRNYKKDGSLFWNEMSVSPVFDAGGELTNFIGIQNDITERKLLEEQLEHQAFHDSLTGLPNRALLMDRLSQALVRSRRHGYSVALLFMDLDDLKVINDSLGHVAGDRLLVGVSERLTNCLRGEDTVARLGGDEFVILLEDVANLDSAEAVAERVARAFVPPFCLSDGREYPVTVSIRIAIGDGSSIDKPSTLIGNGDLAMYRAKEDGKDRYRVFDLSMSERAVRRLDVEQGLRDALKNGGLYLDYQPQVSVASGEIVVLEALVRWDSPERGLVYPSEFIPVAEKSGLITELGRWVLGEACRRVSGWNERRLSEGKPSLSLGVNLSGRDFQRPDLTCEVAEILEASQLAPENLILEITEDVLMKNALSTIARLEDLKKLGVKLAIDDFGTGYSSLFYLKRFPVDYLKIDRTFVEDEAITRLSVLLAHEMGVEVVAEGVDSEEQLERLRTLKCEMAQGYYLHRPAAVEFISRLI